MELDGKEWLCLVLDAFIGAIVCVHKPFFPVIAERFHIHRKAMVLRCDKAALCSVQDAGLVLRAMAIFKLVGIAACC